MDVLIVRDGGATKVPRAVADMGEVEALRAAGFIVEVQAGADAAPAEPAKPAKVPAKKAAKPAKE